MTARLGPLFLFLGFAACQAQTVSEARMQMGTLVEITARGPDRAWLQTKVASAFTAIEAAEARFSNYRPDSELSQINRAAGAAPVAVSEEMAAVLEQALALARDSGGAFDHTVGPLVKLWRDSAARQALPSPEEIAAARQTIGWEKVILDRQHRTVFLPRPGMELDLGGIAKGWAVDRALAALDAPGVEAALVNAGGDLRGLVRRGQPWTVGIQDPADENALLARLELTAGAAATSGQYARFAEIAGRRYGHIIDPRTGQPAAGAVSVTVTAPEAWEADGLATAVFVLGGAEGAALVRSRPGVEAVIVGANGERWVSPGLAEKVVWEREN